MCETEWLGRTEMMMSAVQMEKIRSSHVLVAGLGGVGAYVAEMLCRAGIGKLTLVDGDTVQAGNRNRQLLALCSNEGRLKTEVMAERLRDINPDIDVEIVSEFIRDERLIEIAACPCDYVVDAIDTLAPKTYLLYYALKNGQRIVSSMGAGGKFDPLQVRIDDLSKTYNCRLAYILRKRLRKLGVTTGIQAVFSTEQTDRNLVDACDEPNKKSVVGTVSYIPAIFGCVCASVVIRALMGDGSSKNEEILY